MTDSDDPGAIVQVHAWFRQRVETRLSDAVGGGARLRVIVLLACVLALDSADKSTVGSTAVQLERALHVGNTQIGLLVTVSTAVGALFTLPLGTLSDRVNRTRLLSSAVLVWSIATFVSGMSTSFEMLLFTRLALGAVIATAGPAVASLTGDLFPPADRGRVYGFILSGELIGAGVGFLISGEVAAVLSWRWSFWVLAVPGLALAVVIWRMFPEPARQGQSRIGVGDEEIRSAEQVQRSGVAQTEESSREGRDELTQPDSQLEREVDRMGVQPHESMVLDEDPSDRSLWWAVRYVLTIRTNVLLIVASALGYFFFSGLRTFAVVFLRDRFSIGVGIASTMLVALGAGGIIGVLVTGRVADRLIGRGRLDARPLVAGISFVAAAVLFLPALLTTSVVVAAPLFFLAAVGVGGANPPLDAARLDLMHPRLWGRAEAVRTVLRSSLEALAPLLFGYVSSQFGTHTSGLGHPTGSAGAGGSGLGITFLIMLLPLVAAGLLLLLQARRTYARDVATAIASERATTAAT